MHFLFNLANISFMLDVFVLVATISILVAYTLLFSSAKVHNVYSIGLGFGCVFSLLGFCYYIPISNLSMQTFVAVVSPSMLHYNDADKFYSNLFLALNLLKTFSTLTNLYASPTVVDVLCVTLHIILACRLAGINPVHFLKRDISQIFNLSDFVALNKLLKDKISEIDISSATDNSIESIKNSVKLPVDTTKRFSVARFLISSEWKSVIAIVVGNTLVRVIIHWRQLVFISIIAFVQKGNTESISEIIVLLIIWQTMAITVFISSYLTSTKTLAIKRMQILLILKVLSNSDIGRFSHLPHIIKFNAYPENIISILDQISMIIAEMFNIWIIAKRVGWYFVIPMFITMLQGWISYAVQIKNELKIAHKDLDETPKFYKSYYTAIKHLRIVKLYSWENLFLDNLKPFLHFESNFSLFWKVVNTFVDLLGTAITQISTAITLIAYIHSSGVVITYSELLLLMHSTESLTKFTKSMASEYTRLAYFRKTSQKIESLFRTDNHVYATFKPISGSKEDAIKLDKCQFSWGQNSFGILPITLSIEKGELVTVVGKIGSGKSSLLEGLSGEMPITGGKCCVYGSIAYVWQKPHIMDESIRDNILMGAKYNADFYKQVVEACMLDEDINQFVAGDLTKIGPNGINLSGGQKVRVALARALYMQADIYLFDDVLSAVDAQVERQLVERVLSNNGIIGSKTRILVTHAIHVVPLSNKVITMEDGSATIIKQSPSVLSLSVKGSTGKQSFDKKNKKNCSDNVSDDKATSGTYIIRPEENVKKVNLTHIKWFVQNSGYLALLTLLLIKLINTYMVYCIESWRISLMTDRNPNTMVSSLKWFLFINAIVTIVKSQILHIEKWICQEYWTRKVSTVLLKKYMAFILAMPLPLSERLSESMLLSVASKISYALTNKLPMIIYGGILRNIVYIVKDNIQLTYFSPLLLLPTAFFSVIVYYWKIKYRHATKKLAMLEKRNEYTNNMYLHMLYNKRSFLRVHGLIGTFTERLAYLCVTHCNFINIKTSVMAADRVLTSLFSEAISTMVVLYSIQRFMCSKSDLSPAYIGIAKSMIIGAVQHAKSLSNEIQNLANYGKVLTNVYTYSEGIECQPELAIGNQRPDPNWPHNGTIEFCNYNMRYRPELDIILKDLSFSVKHNEKIGIVGRTGAGKSSITYALMRIVEAESGYIKIDGIDISTLGVHDLRSNIAIIPQDPVLFEGTIRENLDPECKYTDKEVWAAIQVCQFANILETPTAKYIFNSDDASTGPWVEGTGLNKWVESNGANFSVGQRQLVSLCRALLWKRKIVVLDEATANIDNETDRIMQDVLRHNFKDCTVLTIAHRLNTVMDSDRILVMDQGQAVEFDTPVNLLANKSGYFTKLVESTKLNRAI